jgi:hypothetical protein
MKGGSVSQNRNAQRRLVEKAQYRRLVPRLQNVIRLCALFVLMSLLTACDSTIVLLANFTSDIVGSPPGATQATGTVTLDSGAGTITAWMHLQWVFLRTSGFRSAIRLHQARKRE